MRVDLPARLDLACPHCRGAFAVKTKALHKRPDLQCPFCAGRVSIYDALPVQLRRRVYHALRDSVESDVYQRYRQIHQDESDPWGGGPTGPTSG